MAIILESAKDNVIAPMTEVEKDLVHKLRAMLKDCPEYRVRTLNTLVEANYGERWSDELLLIYIQISINNFPMSITGCILMGAYIYAVLAEATLQAGESFSYSDNGISLAIDLSSKYLSLIGAMKAAYDDSIKTAKQSITRPSATAIRTNGAGISGNIGIRSFSTRMWVYR